MDSILLNRLLASGWVWLGHFASISSHYFAVTRLHQRFGLQILAGAVGRIHLENHL